jgi:membrane associated rhomboid family serine protease
MNMKNFKTTPICSFLAVSIITIFSLYVTNAIKTIPCDKDMLSIFMTNFIHIDITHLISNLVALYALSRVEYKTGPKKFFILLIFLLIFNTIFEFILHKIINTPCSIGISGILYGILTFEIICTNNIDYNMLGAVLLNVFISYGIDNKSSLSGHLIGAISGILGAIIFKNFNYFCF